MPGSPSAVRVENAWEKRLADGRLPNVEPRIAPCGV